MYFMLLLLIIIYVSIPEQISGNSSCLSGIRGSLSPREIIAIVYFLVFVVICFGLSLSVVYFGKKLVDELKRNKAKNKVRIMKVRCWGG